MSSADIWLVRFNQLGHFGLLSRAVSAVLVMCGLQTSFALANGALPLHMQPQRDPVASKARSHLEVRSDPMRDVSILRISRSALREAGYELRKITPQVIGKWSPSKSRSIVAALAMSIGIAGTFLVRKKRPAAITVAAISAMIIGGVGIEAWANMAPRPTEPPPEPLSPAFGAQPFAGASFLVDPNVNTLRIDDPEPAVVQYMRLSSDSALGYIPALSPFRFAEPPATIEFGSKGVTAAFSDLRELRPVGGIRMSGSPMAEFAHLTRVPNFSGEILIEVTDEHGGVHLAIGTKQFEPKPIRIGTRNTINLVAPGLDDETR